MQPDLMPVNTEGLDTPTDMLPFRTNGNPEAFILTTWVFWKRAF